MNKALVVFSGGQDSTTCLAWSKNRFDEVEAVSFTYGQKHDIEIEQAEKIASILQVRHHKIDISFYGKMVHSALTGEGDVNAKHADHENLPASFVPNRNALFFLLGHSLAQTIKADCLVVGICETDYSGYPDCRMEFVESIEKSLNIGSDQNIKIEAPLMYLNKAQTFDLAEKEGVLGLVLRESHTCYNGDSTMNEWGRGCDQCPACELRKKGYLEFKEKRGER